MSSVSNCVQKTEKMSGNISRERKHSGTGLSFDMTSLKAVLDTDFFGVFWNDVSI